MTVTRRLSLRRRSVGTGWAGPGSRAGVWAWSFVGFVVATIIVVAALAAVSEIVLPLTFAAVLAVIFKPLVGVLERHRFKPTLAAGLVVLGLLALMTGVVVAHRPRRRPTRRTRSAPRSMPRCDKAADQLDGSVSTRRRWTRPGRPPRTAARRSPAASSPSWSPASAPWSGWPAA